MATTTRTRAAAPKKPARSSAFDLEARLTALPPEATATQPTMPVKIAILEAERLHAGAQPLRAKLARLPGFRIEELADLPALVSALTKAEQHWTRARVEKQAVSLKAVRAEAEKLRRDMMAAGRFLLRRDPAAQRELDRIAEGEGLADLIHDLHDLAEFGETHRAAWAADATLPKDTVTRARALAAQLTGGVDREPAIAALGRRNQIFAALQVAVEEVRAAARYVLRHDPKRLTLLLSQYAAVRQRRSRGAGKAGAAPKKEKDKVE